MKFKVKYEYRAVVTVEVEAADAKAAEDAGMEEADSLIDTAIELYSVTAKEMK